MRYSGIRKYIYYKHRGKFGVDVGYPKNVAKNSEILYFNNYHHITCNNQYYVLY